MTKTKKEYNALMYKKNKEFLTEVKDRLELEDNIKLPYRNLLRIYYKLFSIVNERLSEGNVVEIPNLGKLYFKAIKGRKFYSGLHKREIESDMRYVLKLKPNKSIEKKVNKELGKPIDKLEDLDYEEAKRIEKIGLNKRFNTYGLDSQEIIERKLQKAIENEETRKHYEEQRLLRRMYNKHMDSNLEEFAKEYYKNPEKFKELEKETKEELESGEIKQRNWKERLQSISEELNDEKTPRN